MSSLSEMTVILLCGGQGTRIRAVAEDRPKPMVEIGDKPILWHIMKIYSTYGVRRFVLALGHQGEKIVEYFQNYRAYQNDFTMKVASPMNKSFHAGEGKIETDVEDWEITFAYTGADTMTGGRVKRAMKYVTGDTFLCTYGDGVSDVDIAKVVSDHKKSGNIATMVGVHLPTTFGVVEIGEDGQIQSFREKPVLPGFINGGFFVFEKSIRDFIDDDSTILEDKPFKRLVRENKIGMVCHTGFWHAMDHYKDYSTLNSMWKNKQAPWQIW